MSSPVRNVLRPLRVLAVDDAAEPERGAVRELDRLVGVGHPVDDDTRAEDLLAERPHLRRHVGEDGCLDEGTRPLDALAAGAQRGALGDGVVDLLDERLCGLLRRQRAEVGRRVHLKSELVETAERGQIGAREPSSGARRDGSVGHVEVFQMSV